MTPGRTLLTIERTAATAWLIAVAFTHSDAGVAFPVWIVLFVTMLALAVWWMLRMIVNGFSRARGESWRSRLVVPAAIAAGLAIAASDVMLIVRLRLSETALRGSASALAASPPVRFSHTTRVGLFTVQEFTQYGEELRFLTAECGLVDACGVVFSPAGRPPNRGEDSFTHLYGPWWHWYQSW